MIYYLSGKITGLDNFQEIFEKHEQALKDEGHIVLTPTVFPPGLTWEQYMVMCLPMVEVCDAIALIPNYVDSKGALVELQRAELLGREIRYL